MENGKSDEFEEFIKLITSINDYEKRIESLKDSNNKYNDIGYLVDNDEFKEIKNYINYAKNRGYINPIIKNKLSAGFKSSKFQNIKKLEAIEINSADHIKDILINFDCVLITKELFDLININKRKQIKFNATNINITLFINNNEKIELSHRNFVLDNSSSINNIPINSVDNKIKPIYEQMINYFKFENGIINKSNYEKERFGFLVEKTWIDEWKNYSNYDFVKKNYFEKNNLNINPKEKKIIYKEIIDYREKNKNKYKFPSESNIIKPNNE